MIGTSSKPSLRSTFSSSRFSDGRSRSSIKPTLMRSSATLGGHSKGWSMAAKSSPSAPWIASNMSAQSSMDRAIGPSLSIDQESVMQPCRLTRPNVGRKPDAPQARQGETMLPSVSLPIAKPTNPAATAEAEPADDPLEPVRGSHGLRVRPPNQRSPIASAPNDSLATMTAPASSSRAATVALTSITRSLNGVAPQVVGYPG